MITHFVDETGRLAVSYRGVKPAAIHEQFTRLIGADDGVAVAGDLDASALRSLAATTIAAMARELRETIVGIDATKTSVYALKRDIAASAIPDRGPVRDAIDAEAKARGIDAKSLVADWGVRADAWTAAALAIDAATVTLYAALADTETWPEIRDVLGNAEKQFTADKFGL